MRFLWDGGDGDCRTRGKRNHMAMSFDGIYSLINKRFGLVSCKFVAVLIGNVHFDACNLSRIPNQGSQGGGGAPDHFCKRTARGHMTY